MKEPKKPTCQVDQDLLPLKALMPESFLDFPVTCLSLFGFNFVCILKQILSGSDGASETQIKNSLESAKDCKISTSSSSLQVKYKFSDFVNSNCYMSKGRIALQNCRIIF